MLQNLKSPKHSPIGEFRKRPLNAMGSRVSPSVAQASSTENPGRVVLRDANSGTTVVRVLEGSDKGPYTAARQRSLCLCRVLFDDGGFGAY